MSLTVCFAHNPTGWANNKPVPDGMSAVHIHPVTRHMPKGSYVETGRPQTGHYVNVLYTHRHTYHIPNRERGRVGVFAGHGIADKSWRNADRMLRTFDWAVTTGPAWTKRLADAGYTTTLEVGYCKLDPIFNGETPSAWPERDGRIRVLWAPTHGGGGEKYRRATNPPHVPGARRSSYWNRDTLLAALPASEFHVLEAIHPRHRPDGKSTMGEYVGADVVIADGGSTIYEAWALGLPVVFPTWLTLQAHLARKAETMERTIYERRVGRHAETPDDFPHLVTVAAAKGITPEEVAFIDPVFPPEYRGSSGRRFAERLLDIAGGGRDSVGDHDHRRPVARRG